MSKHFIFLLLFSIPTFGQEPTIPKAEEKDENLIITSQHLDYNHEKLRAHFTINVKAINGETILTSDEMTCFFDKNNDPYLIIAEGNVVITKGNNRAKAQKATYKIKDEIIILRSNPELFDGNNTIKGRTITFHEKERITDIVDADVLFNAELKKKTADESVEPAKKEN